MFIQLSGICSICSRLLYARFNLLRKSVGFMAKVREIVSRAAMSDGGHIITGAGSIFMAPDPRIARLDLNENLFGAAPSVIKAIKDFTQNVGTQWYNAWMRKDCEKTVAEYAGVKQGNVFLGNGSAETLVLIADVFVEPDDEIVCAYPTYRVLPNYAMVHGAKIVEVLHERNFRGDTLPQKMVEKLSSRTKLVYLCNPTTFGARVPKENIIKMLDSAQKGSKPMVIIDEAYFDSATYPLDNVTVTDLIDKYDNLIVVRTFSKSFALAGLRIGYAISCEPIVTQLNKLFSPLGVSSLAYVGAMAAIRDLSYYEDVRRKIEENKKYLSKEFAKLGIETFPSCANFMLARFPPGILNDTGGRKGIWSKLTERGIYLRNKSIMYPRTDLCHDMVRITIPDRAACERLVSELKILMSEILTHPAK